MEHQTGINVETFSAPAPSAGPQFVRNPPVRLFRHPERISFRNRRDPDIPTATFLDRISHIGRRRSRRGPSRNWIFKKSTRNKSLPAAEPPAPTGSANVRKRSSSSSRSPHRDWSSFVVAGTARYAFSSPVRPSLSNPVLEAQRTATSIRGAGYVGRASPRSPSIGSRK